MTTRSRDGTYGGFDGRLVDARVLCNELALAGQVEQADLFQLGRECPVERARRSTKRPATVSPVQRRAAPCSAGVRSDTHRSNAASSCSGVPSGGPSRSGGGALLSSAPRPSRCCC